MEESPNDFRADFVFSYLKLICMSLSVVAWIYTQKHTLTGCKCYCRATIRQTSLTAILPGSWCWQKHSQPLLPSAHPACLFTNSTTKERKNKQTPKPNNGVVTASSVTAYTRLEVGNWSFYLNWRMQSQILMKSILWKNGLHVNKPSFHLNSSLTCLSNSIVLKSHVTLKHAGEEEWDSNEATCKQNDNLPTWTSCLYTSKGCAFIVPLLICCL